MELRPERENREHPFFVHPRVSRWHLKNELHTAIMGGIAQLSLSIDPPKSCIFSFQPWDTSTFCSSRDLRSSARCRDLEPSEWIPLFASLVTFFAVGPEPDLPASVCRLLTSRHCCPAFSSPRAPQQRPTKQFSPQAGVCRSQRGPKQGPPESSRSSQRRRLVAGALFPRRTTTRGRSCPAERTGMRWLPVWSADTWQGPGAKHRLPRVMAVLGVTLPTDRSGSAIRSR